MPVDSRLAPNSGISGKGKDFVMVEGQKSEQTEHLGSHGGRASSWLAVTVMLIGFIVGGVGLTLASWTLVWVGAGVIVVGGILALVFDIFSDVVIDAPRVGMSVEDHR
ncbi:HGxxPAAW family protein [Nonomuraea montanisoli]|nr:HGxxPAAW family protein [Nonomuraea montanisoli]